MALLPLPCTSPRSRSIVSDRPRHSSMFGKWRRKDAPEEPEEDEWFIPYNRRSVPPPAQGGIGQMPHAAGGTSKGHAKSNSESRPRIFPRRPVFPRSGSDGSLDHLGSFAIAEERGRMPSSTSVPTGLAAPKMLFSPLSREMRYAQGEGQQHYPSGQPQSSGTNATPGPGPSTRRLPNETPRQRAVSMPKQMRSPHQQHVYDPSDIRRWAAPTMCDMLVFPRPHITPHTITPPRSPEGISNAFDGLSIHGKVDRDKEREDWQRYAEKNGRSKSFRRDKEGSQEQVGVSRRGSLNRNPSRIRSRSRAASFGEAMLGSGDRPSRKSSKARKGKDKEVYDVNDTDVDYPYRSAPPVVSSFAFATGRHDDTRTEWCDNHVGTQVEGTTRRHRHQHSKSTPDLTQHARSAPRVRMAPSPPRDDGVIVIGPGSPDRRRRQAPPSQPDFSKPLPPLPDEYRLRYNPSSPFRPFDKPSAPRDDLDNVGVALSPDRHPSPAFNAKSASAALSPSAPDDPFMDHQTRSPTYRSETTAAAAAARAMLAKQHQRAVNRRAFNSPRPRQRESSGRSAASATSSFYSQASQRTSAMSAVSPFRRMTALEEAIGRSRAASTGARDPGVGSATVTAARQEPSPQRAPSSRLAVAMSPEPSSESTPRVRRASLDSQTPSPRNHQFEDFKGLFFRTPREAQMRHGAPAMTRTVQMPAPDPSKPPNGLGFDFDEDRRQSASDDSTVEIATPVTMRAAKGPYPGYAIGLDPIGSGSVSSTAMPESFHALGSPSSTAPISSAFMTASTDTSPASHQSGPRQESDESDDDYTVGHAPIHPVVKIGTPQGSDVTATKPRSVVPSVGDSPNSSFGNSTDTIGIINNSNPNENEVGDHQTLDSHTYPHGDAHSPDRRPSAASSGILAHRDSTAVSFIDEFPSPPHLSRPAFDSHATHAMPSVAGGSGQGKHASAFGQLVTGPPGAGKTTYCHGMHQFLTALERPVHIVNLDPAVTDPPYPCAISITSLITLGQVMEEYGLGPNGAMLYCIEYLEANFDWLVERLDELLGTEGNGYVIFDTPGQVELWTNHDSLKNVVDKLVKMDYRLTAVHLSDAHYLADPTKFISVVLLALRAMLQLELPHVNVLSKIDLLSSYGELPFDLRYYTEVQDMGYLLDQLDRQPRMAKFKTLNKAMVELVEEYGMVGFETLAVEDKTSMMKLLRQLDKANGYIYVPSSSTTTEPNEYGLFSTAQSDGRGLEGYLGDVDDVQERWLDNKEMWDEREKQEWKKEGEMRAALRGSGGGQS